MTNRSGESEGGDKADKIRVGLAGLGTIGEAAALRVLAESDEFSATGALVRDLSKPRNGLLDDIQMHQDIDAFLDAGPEVILDALSDGEAGLTLAEKALDRGVSIISANKQAMAGSLSRLHQAAKDNGAHLCYAASVGGGAPLIETVRRARAKDEIRSVTAILNGTVNYILTAVRSGANFDAAVKKAQDAGFAEPDPTADLSGDDSRAKISILSFEAYGREVDQDAIQLEALDAERAAGFIADGRPWRQLSRLELSDDGAINAKVSFEPVADDAFFANVTGEGNAIRVIAKSGAALTCDGLGAGAEPTVGSLFSDLYEIRRQHEAG